MALQAVSARRLYGCRKFFEERFRLVHSDLRKRFSSSLDTGGPKFTRAALNEEEGSVGNSLRTPRNGSGEEQPIASPSGNGDREASLRSHDESGHSETPVVVQDTYYRPSRQSNAEVDPGPLARAIALKKRILQSRGDGRLYIPKDSTPSEAVAIMKNRLNRGISVDSSTVLDILKSCSNHKDLAAARQVHECITQNGMDKYPYVANTLLNVYVGCGRLEDARRVFDGLEKKTPVTWRIMIAGYAKNDRAEDALDVFNGMRRRGLQPDVVTCWSILNACATPTDLRWGKEIHAYTRRARLDSDVRVGSALVQMYAKCGSITEARRVFDTLPNRNGMTWNVMIGAYAAVGGLDEARLLFDRMPTRDAISWNRMIGAYAKMGFGEEAYRLFLQMRREGFVPDAITFMNILNTSARAGALEWVKDIHSHAVETKLDADTRVGNALIHMYAKCGSIEEARRVFDRMGKRNVITWNTMIGAYSESGSGVEAYRLFLQMEKEGFKPDQGTYVSVLNASASAGALDWVKEVHHHAVESGLELDLRVGTALVRMYSKSGSIDDARLVFERLKALDVMSWTTMIGAYAESGRGLEAYRLFLEMEREGFKPNLVTYVSILNASASAGALEWVKEVHNHALRAGLASDLLVGNALVHMYSKSGSIDDARRVFEKTEKRDLVTWTAMLGGLAQHGCGREAVELFKKMNADGVQPDRPSFVAVLSACCHAGLLEDGRKLFLSMKRDYGIEPTVVHYTCMVDLLGRAGHLEEAKRFMDDMPIQPDAIMWQSLLGSCRTHGNVELGELAARELLKLDPQNSGAYVLLSNIYAAAGRWEEVSRVRTVMQEKGVRKEPGRSWIEVDNKVHEFVVGDTTHPDREEIYSELDKLTEKLKEEGYFPDTQIALQNVDEEDKELALCSHSERLAIAYGLMRTPSGKPIRVYKNLRVCRDCHTATKLISKVSGREIVARDSVRFHHFKDGVCSCGDYW